MIPDVLLYYSWFLTFQLHNISDTITDIVLVSFGTSLKATSIPAAKLRSFIQAFNRFPNYTFLWNLDMSIEHSIDIMEMPENVRIHRWLPMKDLMSDPRVTLLITHGGAASCLEAAYAGLPILGISLHSDQHYNTHRLAYFGLGATMLGAEVDADTVFEELSSVLGMITK